MGSSGTRGDLEGFGDDGLVARAADGDTRAFEQLVDRYLPTMYRLAAAMVGPDEARDVTQEALVSAWRELPRLRRNERFEAWLKSILMNRARNVLRSRRRRPQVSWEPAEFEVSGFAEPFTEVHRHLLINDALAALGPDHRAVIVLHYLADLPLREVAEILGLREGTAKSRLHAGLTALRTHVGEAST